MSDFKEARVQQLGPLEKGLMMASGTRSSAEGSGFQLTSAFNSLAGCLGHGHISLVLQLLCLTVLAGILVAALVQDRLCRPCPWDWTFFQGHCYFFSKSQRNWHDSVITCQEEGAQLVVINSAEEQSFLQQTSDIQGSAWLGLSDLNKEGAWSWVDGSPLSLNLTRYWMPGQPNNRGGQDCVEVRSRGWKDSKCDYKKFWVCKRFAASCSTE
uniref:C-type lectin domain-containing protein n=1 Tax=Ictidomys tridecemlineatus TaxID=43179 RepID=A0A287CV88_ICTTR